MAASRSAGVSSRLSGLTSANRGVAPARTTASADAMKVLAGTITSSPAPIPSAVSVSAIASVPLATPIACGDPQYAAQDCSNSSTASPPIKAPDSSTPAQARQTVSCTSRVIRDRLLNGTWVFILPPGAEGTQPWIPGRFRWPAGQRQRQTGPLPAAPGGPAAATAARPRVL